MKYTWVLASDNSGEELKSIYHPAIAHALAHRGILSIQQAEIFLRPDYERDCHDPFLFDDMVMAVTRIARALEKNEKIAIYCDYDVDGLSSGAIVYSTLRQLGGDVIAYMNHRERDGYGLQKDALSKLINEGATLIITTDCGISNALEIQYALENGTDAIITDHHTVPFRAEDIPKATAIIHPLVRAQEYPWKSLAGGGSSFKLAQALIRTDNEFITLRRHSARDNDGNPVNWEAFEKWMLDLVCLSTIGDCVPLQGENRMFVHYGLRVLGKTRRPGLKALMERFKKRNQALSSRTVSFFIAPRINAASRMDHAQIAFNLLTTESDGDAQTLADVLERLNTERQKITEKLVSTARIQLDISHAEEKKLLVGSGAEWPLGILGLVAGRLCDYYQKPVVLMTSGNGCISGAARSTSDFHIAEAFSQIRHHFDRYGGHQAAGGFALKKDVSIQDVRTSLEELGEKRESTLQNGERQLLIDAEISLADISWDLLSLVKKFEPYGVGNSSLRFLLSHCRIDSIAYIGAGEKHVRMYLSQDMVRKQCIGFSFRDAMNGITDGDRVDIVCEIDEHEWKGEKSIQVSLIDIRRSE